LFRALAPHMPVRERYATAWEAIERAAADSGVLLLADTYPAAQPGLDETQLRLAADKRLRLYIECPNRLPGCAVGEPWQVLSERVVVRSGSSLFGSGLMPGTLLDMHACWIYPLEAPEASEHLVAARVAGYDRAAFGLPERTHPVLLEWPDHRLMVAATKLSHFATGRYGPAEAWRQLWRSLLYWLTADESVTDLQWELAVAPRFGEHDPLPEGAEREAFARSVRWFRNHVLFAKREGIGAIEGYVSRIDWEGRQLPRPVEPRADCICETALVFAHSWKRGGCPDDRRTAEQLLDYVWDSTDFVQGDPDSPTYGLVNWYERGPIFYGDDNARVFLSSLAASRLLGDGRWDERMLRCLLANWRLTGPQGFRQRVLRVPVSFADGRDFAYYRDTDYIHFSPHFHAYLWACYLWAYELTGYEPLLRSSKQAIRLTMDAYPGQWNWTNGLTQEIARMLLPLAFLVRVEPTEEHRGWLQFMCDELLRDMRENGVIAEKIGALEQGVYIPPQSNERYGTSEASLLQQNGDPVCDLLYTVNFAFLGLHEAAGALGGDDGQLVRDAENRLADFLCRIQARSTRESYLDGAWLRSFDFERWEYWGSSSDLDWGAWCVESGWTNSWIAAVLAMRESKEHLFDTTCTGRLRKSFTAVVEELLLDQS